MLTFIFIIMMFGVFGKLISLAIRATWGITKICFTIIFLPLALIALACAGLVTIAIPILLIVGVVALIVPKRI